MKFFLGNEFKNGILKLQESKCVEILNLLSDYLKKLNDNLPLDHKKIDITFCSLEFYIELRWSYDEEVDCIILELSDLIRVTDK